MCSKKKESTEGSFSEALASGESQPFKWELRLEEFIHSLTGFTVVI